MPQEHNDTTNGGVDESQGQRAVVLLKAPVIFSGERPKSGVKRKAAVDRSAMEWKCITISASHDSKTPIGQCNFCGKVASWTATRIKEHIMGIHHSKACTGQSDDFLEMKELMSGKLSEAAHAKASKAMKESVATASMGQPTMKQTMMRSALTRQQREIVDIKVAEFFYAENISFRVVESPHFAELVNALRAAPDGYKPPGRRRLGGELLDSECARLRAQDQPLRDALLSTHGCTILCDGWDDIDRNHLVNLLYSTANTSFFEGTTQLTSEQSEDASSIANFIVEGVDKLSPPVASVIHVVTDTCSVMKSAWRLVEKERPWVSTTCCAPHVLNLLLKDIASITEVAGLMSKMEHVLHRFWGRTRWPRTKLKETTLANHGKTLGLYRAKATRFGGKVCCSCALAHAPATSLVLTGSFRVYARAQYRQLARALRLKADLQQVVVSREYADRGLDEGAEADVKQILLDEGEFWKPLVNVLKVATPIMVLLRLCDNQSKEVLGKIYHHMFVCLEGIKELEESVAWAGTAAGMVEARWEYLHGRMHAAAYALDPEFLYNGDGGSLDGPTMDGLIEVVERLSLRHVIQNAVDPKSAAETLNLSSPQVQEQAAECMHEFASFRAKEAIFTKQMVIAGAKTMPPSHWWGLYGSHLPAVQAVARSVLTQPCSASAAERNWSVYGQIKNSARNRMQHEVADKRVYCHETLHYHKKLQSAFYVAQIADWACSDSDSDDNENVVEDDELGLTR